MLIIKNAIKLKTNILVFIEKLNPQYFNDYDMLINHVGILLTDYISYREKEISYDFLEFINHSVNSGNGLNDCIKKENFKVDDLSQTITINKNIQYNFLGELYIEVYKIYISHYYLFIYDTETGKRYMYYMD
jgi:hypothetical protein